MELFYPQLQYILWQSKTVQASSIVRHGLAVQPVHIIIYPDFFQLPIRFLPTSDRHNLMCFLPATRIQLWHALFSSSTLVPFELWICHHVVICCDQNKYEDSHKVGQEAQVLIVKHLQERQQADYISNLKRVGQINPLSQQIN